MILKRVVSGFGLTAIVGLATAQPSSAAEPVATAQREQQQQVQVGDACLTGPADQTKSLAAGKTSVTIAQPNVTPSLSTPPPPPPRPCKSAYVGELVVSSSSTPPSGFTERYNVSANWQSGNTVDKKDCLATKPDVKIYKKTTVGFAWVGGGVLVPTFHPETPQGGPATCTFSEQAGYKPVAGKVPSVEIETYRVLVSFAGVGSSVASITRVAK